MIPVSPRCALLLASSLVALILAGCSTCSDEPFIPHVTGENEALVDKSLITADPCELPCWYGITPGETTSTEAAVILAKLDFVDQDSIDLLSDCLPSNHPCFQWGTSLSGYRYRMAGLLLNSDMVVVETHYDLEYDLTIGELVEQLGEPDQYFYGRARDCYKLALIWLSKGVEASIAGTYSDHAVNSTMLVDGVSYFSPVPTVEEYFQTTQDFSLSVSQDRAKDYHDWHGFDDEK